jgi:hypothetical protein
MIKFPHPTAFDLDSRWAEYLRRSSPDDASGRDRFYRGSYPFILSHFSTCTFDETEADCGRFWQALILVYSWMGRGILINFDGGCESARLLTPDRRPNMTPLFAS